MERPRVLIIDDSVSLANAFRRALEGTCDCVVATDDVAAFAALRRDHFDAIVCDMVMPNFSGPQLHRWLSTTRPELVDRLVFVTGLDPMLARRALNGATVPVLEKPVSIEVLRAMIEKMAARAAE